MGEFKGFMKYDKQALPELSLAERLTNHLQFQQRFTKEDAQRQGARCMDCGTPFCQTGQSLGRQTIGCPIGNYIPEWNDLVYHGDFREAYERLSETNNFPDFTGRVCPAPCEQACVMKINRESIAIKGIERTIIDEAFENGWVQPRVPEKRLGQSVAIVGSGPAGLTAADELNAKGYDVTVYERAHEPGGLLMYGIPNMKLDKEIVQRRIDLMEKLGINFVANTEVGRDVTADELLKQYDRVVLATGASVPRDLDVPGRHLSGVRFAVDFLTETTKNVLASDNKKLGPTLEGKHVLVIGGGDTGNDCIGTAVRLGAASVKQLEITPEPPEKRLPTNPWPQYPMIKRVGYGQEEANFVQDTELTTYATSTTEFIGADSGQVIAAKTIKVGPGFKPIEGTEEIIKADLVLLAMGFTGAEKSLFEQFGVQSVYDDYSTNNDHVFVAGDARRGPSLVIWGIREGRKAAEKIDQGLRVMVAQ